MSATIKGEGASSVISQLAPTSCIIVPMLETTEAIQRKRKSSCASVAHDDGTGGSGPDPVLIAGTGANAGLSASIFPSDIVFLEYNKRALLGEC